VPARIHSCSIVLGSVGMVLGSVVTDLADRLNGGLLLKLFGSDSCLLCPFFARSAGDHPPSMSRRL
jgi:hypothetical protein